MGEFSGTQIPLGPLIPRISPSSFLLRSIMTSPLIGLLDAEGGGRDSLRLDGASWEDGPKAALFSPTLTKFAAAKPAADAIADMTTKLLYFIMHRQKFDFVV